MQSGDAKDALGRLVTVTVDRPMGTHHPEHPDLYYPVNYGFVEGVMAPDGDWQDAYILGVSEPVSAFTGRVVAVVCRRDDVEDKWVVAPEGAPLDEAEIRRQVFFQERYFDAFVVMQTP